MNVRLLTLAQLEIDEAFVWFEQQDEGKGIEFLDELDRVVRLVKSFPLASTEIEPEIRRCLFARFPYSLNLRTRARNDRRYRCLTLIANHVIGRSD